MTLAEFTQVYEENRAWLARVAARMLAPMGRSGDSEDFVQNCFAYCLENPQHYLNASVNDFSRMMTIAVRNRARDLYLVENGSGGRGGGLGRRTLLQGYAALLRPSTSESAGLSEAVSAVWGELSAEQQMVGERYWLDGDGMRTIAMELGVSNRSAWRLLSSARLVLEDRLGRFATSKKRESRNESDDVTTAQTIRQRVGLWRSAR